MIHSVSSLKLIVLYETHNVKKGRDDEHGGIA